MSNKSQVIVVRDMIHCIRDGMSELDASSETVGTDIDIGAVISEVGPAVPKAIPAYTKPIQVYQLRKRRKYKLPGHIFGKAHLGDAYSAFIAIPFQAPAIGSRVVLNPKVTYQQREFMALYRFVQADAVWMIVTPSPLGVGIMLRAYAPEFDNSTETRGVRFRPATASPIGLELPWSNDLSVIPLGAGRPGQSGLSLVIETVEDNTLTEVGTPLDMIAFCCVHNVHLSGLTNVQTEHEMPGLNFTRVSESRALPYYQKEDDEDVLEYQTEVSADATNEVAEGIASETGEAGNITTSVEEAAKAPTKPKKGTSAAKNQTGVLNATWFQWTRVTVSQADVNQWRELEFNPYTFRKRGETLALPYLRNVWTSGQAKKGYVSTVAVKFAIPRAPQISGLVEIYDSLNASSRILLAFGETKEMELIPSNFAEVPVQPVRYANNPWLRTNEAKCKLRYRVLAINRNGDIADTHISLMVRPGSAVFQGPTKPKRQANLNQFGFFMRLIDESFDCLELHTETQDISNMMLDLGIADDHVESEDFITALAGDMGEIGETNDTEGLDETIDQDDFGVEVFRGTIPIGTTTAISINLAAINDTMGEGEENPITQKFQRFAHVQPKKSGTFGPCIGRYIIKVRLPATEAGDIQSVLVPNDMNDQAVVAVFGLSSILSTATAALQPVGGALISGAINAGRNILGGLVKNLIGGKDSTEAKDTNPSSSPNIFGGGFDLSRFINFLKPVVENEVAEPTMATLLVAAKDFFNSLTGRALTEIPISVIMKMDEHTVERTIYNRSYEPVGYMPNELWVPKDRYSYIAEAFVAHPRTFILGSEQNIWFTKYILTLEDHINNGTTDISICLNEIAEKEYTRSQGERMCALQRDRTYYKSHEWETRNDIVSGESGKHFSLSMESLIE